MIFQHTAPWVLEQSPNTGKPKTLTSRPVRDGDYIHLRDLDGNILLVKDGQMRIKYVAGQTYAIQPGRGKPALARFILTRIERAEYAGRVTQAQAEAEGFATPKAFRDVWMSLYGLAATELPCWRLHLAVVR